MLSRCSLLDSDEMGDLRMIHMLRFSAVLLVVLFSACGGTGSSSEQVGVELFPAAMELNPTSTFEVRFDAEMVDSDRVGIPGEISPITILPSLDGTFAWQSRRSGVFIPTKPFPLDATYIIRLKSGLLGSDGKRSTAKMHRVFRTPALQMKGGNTSNFGESYDGESEVPLAFNGEIRLERLKGQLQFQDSAAGVVDAEIEVMKSDDNRLSGAEYRTWSQRFHILKPIDIDAEDSTSMQQSRLQNRFVARPTKPLPAGKDWRLILKSGLPDLTGRIRTKSPQEIKLGVVEEMKVLNISPQNELNTGRRLHVVFSKQLLESNSRNYQEWIKIEPQPNGIAVQAHSSNLEITGEFELGKEYTVTVQQGLPAAGRRQTLSEHIRKLEFKPVTPRIYFPSHTDSQFSGGHRSFRMLAVNNRTIHLKVKRLDPSTIVHALRGYDTYLGIPRYRQGEYWDNRLAREMDYDLVPGKTIFTKVFQSEKPVDQSDEFTLSWNEVQLGIGPSAVFVQAVGMGLANRPVVVNQSILQITDLGVLWKKSSGELFVSVFSLKKGSPVGRATIQLLDDESTVLSEATADELGIGKLKIVDAARWIAVTHEADFHVLPLNSYQSHLRLWDLGIHPSDSSVGTDAMRIKLFSDRPVYQPREVVHLKGIIRRSDSGQLVAPAGKAVSIVGIDSHNHTFYRTNTVLSVFGSFDVAAQLPESVLGVFRFEVNAAGATAGHHIEVQEYRPNTFELKVPELHVWTLGDSTQLPVSARYYFGKPLLAAQLKWVLESNMTFPGASRHERFTFGNSLIEDDQQAGASLSGQLKLDAKGEALIPLSLPTNTIYPGPITGSIRMEVTDVNQQTVSATTEFVRHSSDFYLGARSLNDVCLAGDPIEVELLAVSPDGKPHDNPVVTDFSLDRINWKTTRIEGAGGTIRFQNERTLTPVAKERFNLPVSSGPLQLPLSIARRLIPRESGAHLLTLRAVDRNGRAVLTTLQFHCAGEKPVSWDYQSEFKAEIVCDKQIYKAGENAQLLIKTPISGTALVTVERERVLRSFQVELKGNAPVISVPIDAADAPNVFVSVFLLRGAEHSTRKVKSCEYRVGYCELKIDQPETRLKVQLALSNPTYRPGDKVAVTGRITDHLGEAAAGAEVTLFAVDAGILSLGNYPEPNLHEFFYSPRQLGVITSTSFPHMLSEDPSRMALGNKGHIIGGGGDGPNGRLRKNFLACAFWNGTLLTSDHGEFTASFEAPDGLTEYKIFAVVQAANGRFGNATSSFRIQKPLMIEPAPPGFVRVGDDVIFRAIVYNQTDRDQTVSVRLQVNAKAKLADRTQMKPVTLKAGGQQPIEFKVEISDVGELETIWKAVANDDSSVTDSVQSNIQSFPAVGARRAVVFARLAGLSKNLMNDIDPVVAEGIGDLTVTLSNSRLTELSEAVDQLLHYPYGCLEQTSSSLLPWIILKKHRHLFPGFAKSDEQMQRAIDHGINRILSMQLSNGAMAYWPGAHEPFLWGTAYAGMVLHLAKESGFDVPQDRLERLAAWLHKSLRDTATHRDKVNGSGFVLYVLSLLGESESGYEQKWVEQSHLLSLEDCTFLAMALGRGEGQKDRAQKFLAQLANRKEIATSWYGPTQLVPLRLLAWLESGSNSVEVDRLVTELISSKRTGHWNTTQGNAWSLLALTSYARIVESDIGAAVGALNIGGVAHPFSLDRSNPIQTIRAPYIGAVKRPQVDISIQGAGKLFAQIKLETRPVRNETVRQDSGLSIQRTYQKIAIDGKKLPATDLAVGDLIEVSLNLQTDKPAHFVVVDDALPSLFEAVNPTLKTQRSLHASPVPGWITNHQEFRRDRALFFCDHLSSGQHKITYLARVRAAGNAIAPATRAEEMYRPERFGTSASSNLRAIPLP